MHRTRIVALAVLLGLVGAALPLIAMSYLSWLRAVETEHARLVRYAERAVLSVTFSYAEARSVLGAAEHFTGIPCSEEHIARMRSLEFNSRVVEQVAYIDAGVLRCTSWGTAGREVRQPVPDFVTRDGVAVWMSVRARVGPDKLSSALRHGAYEVLVDPERYFEMFPDADVQIAVATEEGTILGTFHGPDLTMVRSLIDQPGNGMLENHLYAIVHAPGGAAVAIAPRVRLLETVERELFVLLPLGAIIASVIVGIVIWMSRRRLSPLGELTVAVRNLEFVAHYQPLVDLASGRCIGAEALVRWRRPDGTFVRPEFFIPLAEDSDLIQPITDQVIACVVTDLTPLLLADRSLHIAINLSADDVRTGRFLPVLQQALAKTGIENQQIWLEATERGFMDIEAARATIIKARQLGHTVAIDDFGTGYSSLSYLQGFPLDVLKIDKSFIDTIGLDAATSAVTPHIIDMAKSLNLRIVAEGVETEFQEHFLIEHHVDYGQGWRFSKALPAPEFMAFCRRNVEAEPNGAHTPLPA